MDFFVCFVFGIIKKKIIFKIHTQEKRVATYTSTNLKVVFDNGTWNYLHTAFVFIYRDIIFFLFSFFVFFWKKTKKWQSQPDNQAVVKQFKEKTTQEVWKGKRKSVRKGPDVALGLQRQELGWVLAPRDPGRTLPFLTPTTCPIKHHWCDQPFLKPSEAKLFFFNLFFFLLILHIFNSPHSPFPQLYQPHFFSAINKKYK